MTIRYVKLDMKHARFAEALEQAREAFEDAYPKNQLGVSENKDKSACWLKTTTEHGLEGHPALLDEAPEGDVARVASETSSEAWTGPRQAGGPLGMRPGKPK